MGTEPPRGKGIGTAGGSPVGPRSRAAVLGFAVICFLGCDWDFGEAARRGRKIFVSLSTSRFIF